MKSRLRAWISLTLVLCFAFSLCIPTYAASMTDSYDDTVLLGFTEYGWVSFDISASYTENYTANTNSNTYTSRSISYYVTASRSDNPAGLTHGNVYHKDGSGNVTSQYSLTSASAIFPGDAWRYGYKTNSSTVTYSLTSAFTGNFGFSISDTTSVNPFSTVLSLLFGTG